MSRHETRRRSLAVPRSAGATVGRTAAALVLGSGLLLSLSISLAVSAGEAPAGAASNITPTIFVANYDGATLTSYPLTASGNVAPSTTNSSSILSEPWNIAFDSAGNLWEANFGGSTVAEFSAAQIAALGTNGSPTPVATISSTSYLVSGISHDSIDGPSTVAFDAAGDLWVANWSEDIVVEFTPAQLAALGTDGSPTPAATIVSSTFSAPSNLVFDAAGDLWVENHDNNTLDRFSAAQLSALGTTPNPTPVAVIASTTYNVGGSSHASLSDPYGLTMDAAGDLWAANAGDTVVEFGAAQLVVSGSPTPVATITSSAMELPNGLAFDSSGNLWVTDFDANSTGSIFEFSAAQLAALGANPAPTPAATIVGGSTGLGAPIGIALDEAPTVTSVSPASGPSAGGTTVTVNGTGFTPGSTVSFGTAAASSVTYLTPYELTAVSPPGSGTVDVTVSTFAGTSAVTPADQFTYSSSGYWEVASDGGIFSFGKPFYGSTGGQHLNAPVVGMAAAPNTAGGYWEVASDGGLFAYHAPFLGSMGGKPLNKPVVGMAADPATGGYWEVASDGGIFSFGAPYFGSMGGKPLNEPIVGVASTPDGGGYWEVASDGGLFAFGDAQFYGSMGGRALSKPIVGMAASTATGGYWEVASDGGIFAFNAPFLGSMGGKPLNAPVVGMLADSATGGYWEVASDGGLFAFNAPFLGSMGGKPLNKPMVGMAG